MSSMLKWWNNLKDVEKLNLIECVNKEEKWNKGMGSIFWRGQTVMKYQFDWVKKKHNRVTLDIGEM